MKEKIKKIKIIINYIETKINPYVLNEYDKNNISLMLNTFSLEEIISAVDISFANYIKYNDEGNIDESSISNFLIKINGIAYNNRLSPIEKEIKHILNIGKKNFTYWDNETAKNLLNNYIKALRSIGYSDEQVEVDLRDDIIRLLNTCRNWSQWQIYMKEWIKQVQDSIKDNEFEIGKVKINKKYKIIKELGNGSFGITYLCYESVLKKYFVIKRYLAERINEEENALFLNKFINEISIMFNFHHENIVSIYDYKINKKDALYVMEYIDGENIDDYIKNNKNKINEIFIQLINVFTYLENNQYCHRDIRSNNIMVNNNGVVKLIDFGFARELNDTNSIHSATKLIDYPYLLPSELKLKKPKYDVKTEIYFVGSLIDDLIKKHEIKTFKYSSLLKKMTYYNYNSRVSSFEEILNKL